MFRLNACRLFATLALGSGLLTGALLYGQESAPETPRQTPVARHGVMHLDDSTRKYLNDSFSSAPRAFIDPEVTYPAAMNPSLLDHITYNPVERDQGSCGNCFAFTTTALLEILHSTQTGVNDRLSVQWFNSNLYGYTPPGSPTSFKNACVGGNVAGVLNVYYEKGMQYVPWSNKNAQFQDGNYNGNINSPPAVPASAISTNPSYVSPKHSIEDRTITTTGVSQATAIANIKNVLLQGEGVGYFYSAATNGGMAAFQNWWNTASETDLFNPDTYCGESQKNGMDAHETTIVGYDASDPNSNNWYWLVLNQWGTTSSRPNGLFRVKMNIDYGCAEERIFETLQPSGSTPVFNNTNSMYLAATNSNDSGLIETRKFDYSNGDWGYWTSAGKDASYNPVLVTYNTRQYEFVQGGYAIYMRSMGASDSWSAWTEVAGKVSPASSPAAVVFQNNLYLFASSNANNTASSTFLYNVLSDKGSWSGWTTVPYSYAGHSPAAVVFDGRINLFETNQQGHPAFATLNGAGQWNGWWILDWNNVITDAAPAVAAWNGSLYLTIKEQGTETIQIAHSDGDPTGATWASWSAVPGNGHSAHGPAIAGVSPQELCLAMTGQTSTTLYMQCYIQNLGWLGWTTNDFSGVGSDVTPAINTYWFN
jgi:hypothetical protein